MLKRRKAGATKKQLNTLNPTRVLVVDDVALNQRMISMLLRQHDCNVSTSSTGEQAVAMCSKEDFQFVLMDVNLPGINGMQATEQIRELPIPTQPIIIGLSAHAGKKDLRSFLDSGMNDCLPKPIDLENLISLMDRHLNDNSPIASNSQTNGAGELGAEPQLMVLNVAVAMKRLGSNRKLFMRFIEVFRQDIPQLMSNGQAAVDEADWQVLGDTAHRIRGVAANLSAEQFADAAKRVEEACATGNGSVASSEFSQLELELEILNSALGQFEGTTTNS